MTSRTLNSRKAAGSSSASRISLTTVAQNRTSVAIGAVIGNPCSRYRLGMRKMVDRPSVMTRSASRKRT